MTARWLTQLVRRNVASVYIYGLLRSAMLVLQWLIRRPDEPDLRFLARLPRRDGELILDIGANGGQSAVAMGFIRPQARILSYEPVPSLWAELARVQMLLGDRFDFRKYGLGNAPGNFALFLPVSGALPITTRASISREAALENCRELEQAVGLPTRIEEVEIEVRKGDSESLGPSAIKIDVEGTEFQVVLGLRQTIEAHRPLVILERSGSYQDCAGFFGEIGYDILTGNPVAPDTRHLPGLSARNWIACPSELTERFTAG